MLNRAIAFKQNHKFLSRLIHKKLTVNAMLTVNSFPRTTNTKKEMMETRIGANVQIIENITLLMRAKDSVNDKTVRRTAF
jgi:hypothetical protein